MDPKAIFIITILSRENVDTLMGCQAASSLPVGVVERCLMLLSIGWMHVITHVCHVLFIGRGDNLMSMLAQRVIVTGGLAS
jgi:hypothetical protein